MEKGMQDISKMTDTQISAELAEWMGLCVHVWFWSPTLFINNRWVCSKCREPVEQKDIPPSCPPIASDIKEAFKVLDKALEAGWYVDSFVPTTNQVSFTLKKYVSFIEGCLQANTTISRANRTLDKATARAIAEACLAVKRGGREMRDITNELMLKKELDQLAEDLEWINYELECGPTLRSMWQLKNREVKALEKEISNCMNNYEDMRIRCKKELAQLRADIAGLELALEKQLECSNMWLNKVNQLNTENEQLRKRLSDAETESKTEAEEVERLRKIEEAARCAKTALKHIVYCAGSHTIPENSFSINPCGFQDIFNIANKALTDLKVVLEKK